MAIFDRFRSRQGDEPAQNSTAAPQEVLHDQSASSAALGGGEELRDPSASSSVPAAFSTEDTPVFYNPYEGLSAAIDNRSLRGGYKLPQQPEFLFNEEATVHRRGWGENLTYYTGTGYLSGGFVTPFTQTIQLCLTPCSHCGVMAYCGVSLAGALLGGSQGLVAATRVKPEIGPDTARLRINRFLNMTGTRGRTAGNALGVLGLLFAGIESGLGYLNDGTVPDSAATVAAGGTELAALHAIIPSFQLVAGMTPALPCRVWHRISIQICSRPKSCSCCWGSWGSRCIRTCDCKTDLVTQPIS